MAAGARHAPLDDIVDLLPGGPGEKDVRARLRKLTQRLDEIAVQDGDETFVDRKVARRLLREDGVFPPEVHDRVARDFEKHLGKKLKDGKGRRIGWRELGEQDNPLEPLSADRLRELGFDGKTSADKAREIVLREAPDFPPELLDADASRLREIALKGIEHNRTVWDCVVSKIGYWATLGVFALFGALLIIGTATGPWGIPLVIFLAATLGFGTATIVGNCVLNPNR